VCFPDFGDDSVDPVGHFLWGLSWSLAVWTSINQYQQIEQVRNAEGEKWNSRDDVDLRTRLSRYPILAASA
jgi:hypothetical protein